jgi:hypothetical protein
MNDKRVAKRMKTDFKEYKRLISNNLWMTFLHAYKRNAIEGLGIATCPKSLVEATEVRSVVQCSMFGCTVDSNTYSKCPLITKPIVPDSASAKKTKVKHLWMYFEK